MVNRDGQLHTGLRGFARVGSKRRFTRRIQRSQIVEILAAGEQAHFRQAIGARRLHVITVSFAVLLRGKQRGIVSQRDLHRFFGALRQQRQRRRRLQLARRRAHQTDVVLAARNQVGLRAFQVAPRLGEARLRLRDIGLGQVAHLEAIVGRLQIDLEHMHVLGVQPDDRLVTDHIHVRADHLRKEIGLRLAQIGPPRFDACFCRLHRIAHAAARIDRQRNLRRHGDRLRRLQVGIGTANGKVGIVRFHVGARQAVGPRQRHGFVGCAQPGAGARDRRVAGIGLLQRLLQRIRERGRRENRRQRGAAKYEGSDHRRRSCLSFRR